MERLPKGYMNRLTKALAQPRSDSSSRSTPTSTTAISSTAPTASPPDASANQAQSQRVPPGHSLENMSVTR
jgi:hypothetical protein